MQNLHDSLLKRDGAGAGAGGVSFSIFNSTFTVILIIIIFSDIFFQCRLESALRLSWIIDLLSIETSPKDRNLAIRSFDLLALTSTVKQPLKRKCYYIFKI